MWSLPLFRFANKPVRFININSYPLKPASKLTIKNSPVKLINRRSFSSDSFPTHHLLTIIFFVAAPETIISFDCPEADALHTPLKAARCFLTVSKAIFPVDCRPNPKIVASSLPLDRIRKNLQSDKVLKGDNLGAVLLTDRF